MWPLGILSVSILSSGALRACGWLTRGWLLGCLVMGCSVMGGLLMGMGAAQAAVSCPEHLTENGKFHMLQDMKIYDGAEAAESEIIAELSGKIATWNITTLRAAGADPQVKCSFKHTVETRTIAVPEDAKTCRFTSTYPATSICE